MDRKTVFLAMLAGLTLAASAPLALAGDRQGDDGWRSNDQYCGCAPPVVRREIVIHEAPPEETVHLSDAFFADSGGVGPTFIDTGGGGGGFAIAESNANANASASAFASAQVSVQVNERQRMMRQRMMQMRPMMQRRYYR
jgi:hypothetical protein